MKTLKDCIKDCIKEHINESVWDIEDNVESDNKEFVIDDVKKFIEDNYNNISRYCEFIFDDKRGKYIVNCKQSVRFESEEEYLTNGLFEWGDVSRYFHCRGCENLKSLEGAPKEVGGNFYCEGPNLLSLDGIGKVKGKIISRFLISHKKTS